MPLELVDFLLAISLVSNQPASFHRIDELLCLERGAIQQREHGSP